MSRQTELIAFKYDPERKELLEFAVSVLKFPDRSALIRAALDNYLDWDKLRQVQEMAQEMMGPGKVHQTEEVEVVLKGKVLGG